jgi:hypothetical protein
LNDNDEEQVYWQDTPEGQQWAEWAYNEYLRAESKNSNTESEKSTDVILGVTHLLVNGKPERLLKCPFCNFQSIHEDTITHHIRYTNDPKHDVDIDQLDNTHYIVSRAIKESPYGPYVRTEDLPLPWINCLWCDHGDKIAFDLSLHFLEEHLEELLAIPITRRERLAAKALRGDWYARFESPMEYRLDKAVRMACQKTESESQDGIK